MSYPSRGRGSWRGPTQDGGRGDHRGDANNSGHGNRGDRRDGGNSGGYRDNASAREWDNNDRRSFGDGGGNGRGGGNGGDDNPGFRLDRDPSRRRPTDDDGDDRSKRGRYENQERPRGKLGIGRAVPPEARPRRARIPLQEFREQLRKERDKRMEDELNSYDNVPTRPATVGEKKGISGTVVQLSTNFYQIRTRNNVWTLHNYDVAFDPPVELTRVKRALIKEHLPKYRGHLFTGTNLYTPHCITEENLVCYSARENDEMSTITLKLVGTVKAGDTQYLQIYASIIRDCFRILKLDELGRYFYDRELCHSIPGKGLNIWPGYTTAVRQFDGGIMLNLDIRHKVLRTDTCLQVLRHKGEDGFYAAVVGSIVITHYNRKTYKIHDVNYDLNPLSTFQQQKGDKTIDVTFLEYYQTAYPDFKISDMEQPLLVHRPSKKDRHRGQKGPVLLIPELCNLTGLTQEERNDYQLMGLVHNVTSMDPAKRVEKLRTFMTRLWDTQKVKQALLDWGMKLNPSMAQVVGRVLPIQKLTFGKGEFPVDQRADWTEQAQGPMFKPVELKRWFIVVGNDRRNCVGQLLDKFKDVFNGLNFEYNPSPLTFYVTDTRDPRSYVNAVSEGLGRVKDPQLIFVILSTPSSEVYGAVKRQCNLTYGILTQCFQAKHLSNQARIKSIITKVGVQMTAKLGGEPWVAKNPFSGTLTMIVGFDLHHSGKGRMAVSMGALVATTNSTFSQFYSTVSTHTNREMLSTNLCADFTKCLAAFHKKNGDLPHRIIIYRDGVGQGDLTYVHSTELAQIETSIESVYAEKNKTLSEGLTFIVVTKKGNARLIRQDQRGTDNPAPGTVVDSVITLPERYDFFLVSSKARRGQSVSPTTYNVLKVGKDFVSPDKLQILTHRFCCLYYNWSGTVGVPFVCQYAHKLSYLSGTAYRNDSGFVSEQLSHYLYFL